MTQAIIDSSWRQISLAHKTGAFEALARGYSDPSRCYHDWSHLEDLLSKLEAHKGLTTRSDLICAAIFWHDGVYVTRAEDGAVRLDEDNVKASAALFESFSAFSATDTQAVRDLILATATHLTAQPSIQYYDGFGRDMDFFLDLDLSSLGASWPVFRDNLDRIRVEFSFVPEQEFYHDRLRMFDKFLSYGDRLFRLDASRAFWLAQAQSNIARASQELIDSLKN